MQIKQAEMQRSRKGFPEVITSKQRLRMNELTRSKEENRTCTKRDIARCSTDTRDIQFYSSVTCEQDKWEILIVNNPVRST